MPALGFWVFCVGLLLTALGTGVEMGGIVLAFFVSIEGLYNTRLTEAEWERKSYPVLFAVGAGAVALVLGLLLIVVGGQLARLTAR